MSDHRKKVEEEDAHLNKNVNSIESIVMIENDYDATTCDVFQHFFTRKSYSIGEVNHEYDIV